MYMDGGPARGVQDSVPRSVVFEHSVADASGSELATADELGLSGQGAM